MYGSKKREKVKHEGKKCTGLLTPWRLLQLEFWGRAWNSGREGYDNDSPLLCLHLCNQKQQQYIRVESLISGPLWSIVVPITPDKLIEEDITLPSKVLLAIFRFPLSFYRISIQLSRNQPILLTF